MTERQLSRRRWYGHPFVIGALAVCLLVDVFSIPNEPDASSTIRHAISGFRYPPSYGHPYPIVGHPYRTDDEIVWRFRWEFDEGPPRDDLRSIDLNWFGLWPVSYDREGFYHLTQETQTFTVSVDDVSAEDIEAVLIALVDALEEMPNYDAVDDPLVDMIRAGVRTRSFPIYTGYARNAFAASLWIALFFCCARGKPREWFCEPRLGFYSKYSLSERRQMRNQCAKCGYNLAGLNSAICPECGSERKERMEETRAGESIGK